MVLLLLDGEIMVKRMEASVTLTETHEAKQPESLSGTDQTHTAMRQERVRGSIPKVGEGEVRCGSSGGGGGGGGADGSLLL